MDKQTVYTKMGAEVLEMSKAAARYAELVLMAKVNGIDCSLENCSKLMAVIKTVMDEVESHL